MHKLKLPPHDNPNSHPAPVLVNQGDGLWQLCFDAMASPCEVLLDCPELSEQVLIDLCRNLVRETWRIEAKYSRYRSDSLIHKINQAQGAAIELDAETQGLITFADTCFHLSDGMFDITSGILRRLWNFKSDQALPSQSQIDRLLPLIGWQKCQWQPPFLRLPAGAEIDLGGLGKEYAADRALTLLTQAHKHGAFLVNFGGDIACSGPRPSGAGWQVGLARASGVCQVPIVQGGIATSGDTHRFIQHKGHKYSHILNPKTGWPVGGGPATVTVIAGNCTQAGMLATFALLHGAGAERFLQHQGCAYLLGV